MLVCRVVTMAGRAEARSAVTNSVLCVCRQARLELASHDSVVRSFAHGTGDFSVRATGVGTGRTFGSEGGGHLAAILAVGARGARMPGRAG